MKHRVFLILAPVFLLIASCTLPMAQPAPIEEQFSTPNMTMTALFGSGILGSLTPAPETVPSATQAPAQASTDTSLPPTATTAPSDTPAPSSTPTQTQTSASGPTATMTPPPTLTPSGHHVSTNTPSGHYVFTNTPSGYQPSRSGTLFQADYMDTPPVIDGGWGEWSAEAYSAGYIVYGYGNWVGESDLEASFRAGWDEDYLYLAVKVKDDIYAQDAGGADMYLGDSIELMLDTDLYGDFYWDELSYDDYQLGISPGRPDVDGTREAYLWFPRSIEGSRSKVQIASTRADGVYRVEAAIPWYLFDVDPYSGQHFGFALSASDNDNTEANEQQTMASSASNRHLLNPTTWGEMTLTW